MTRPPDLSSRSPTLSPDDTMYFTEGLGLTREQVGRALILGISSDFGREIGQRRKIGLQILEEVRQMHPTLQKQILHLGTEDGYKLTRTMSTDYELLKIQITIMTERLLQNIPRNYTLQAIPFYTRDIVEARRIQALLFLMDTWRRYRLIPGRFPTLQADNQKKSYYAHIVKWMTIPKGVLSAQYINKPVDGISESVSIVSERRFVVPDMIGELGDSFHLSGIVQLTSANYDMGVRWLEEAIVLGGWMKSESPFPKLQKEVLDRFFLKYHEYCLDRNSEIGNIFRVFAPNYVPSKGLMEQIRNKETLPKAPKKTRTSTKIQQKTTERTASVLKGEAITLSQISRNGFFLSKIQQSVSISLVGKGYSPEERYDFSVDDSGYVDIGALRLYPLADYKISVYSSENNPIDNPLIELRSPIREYVRLTAPIIQSKIENTTIRNRQKTQARTLIKEWNYPEYVVLAIRPKDTPSAVWRRYNPDDDIDFGGYMPGEYELCFLINDSENIEEVSPFSGRLPSFRIKLEIIRTIDTRVNETLQKPPTPTLSPQNIAKVPVNISSEESWILELAEILETGKEQISLVQENSKNIYTFSVEIHGVMARFQGDRSFRFSGDYAKAIESHRDILEKSLFRLMDEFDGKVDLFESQRIISKLRPTISYVQRIFDPLLGEVSPDEMLGFSDLLRGFSLEGRGYYGSTVLQPWGQKSRDLLTEELKRRGVHIQFGHPINGKDEPQRNHLDISLSLEGEERIAGSIRSKSEHPYYDITLDSGGSPDIRETMVGILQNLLVIFGSLYQIKGRSPTKAPSKKKGTPDKKILTLESIEQIIVNPARFNIERLGLDRSTLEEIWARFEKGEGKISIASGYDQIHGYPKHTIRTRQSQEILTENHEEGTTLIVVRDERLASMPEGRKGNPAIHDFIRHNTRIQKYLIKRILATLKGNTHDGNAPLSGTMQYHFSLFWNRVPEDKKAVFLELAQRSKTEALAYEISPGMTLMADQLAVWKRADVHILYNKPVTMSVSDYLEARGEKHERREIVHSSE